MQKYLEILEQKVEWLALGLAALWVLFIAWTYWLSAPVTIEVAGETFGPAEVDDFVEQEKLRLQERLTSNARLKVPQPPDFTAEFARTMQPRVSQPLGSAYAIFQSPPPPAKSLERQQAAPDQAKIAALPEPIKIIIEGVSSGRSAVVLDKKPLELEPEAADDPNAAAAAAAVPGGFIPAGGFGAGAGGGFGAGVQVDVEPATDILWVSVFGRVPEATLFKSFQAAGVPVVLLNVREYLEVQVERAEVLPGGKPGKPVLVPPLVKDAPPVNRQKDPETFLNWLGAQANQERVLRPAFYTVQAGDPWGPPGAHIRLVDAPGIGMPNLDVDPPWVDVDQAFQHWQQLPTQQRKNAFRDSLTPEQRRQLHQRIQKEEQEARPRPQPNQPRTPQPPRQRNQAHDPRVIGEMYAQSSGGAYIPGGPPISGARPQPAPMPMPVAQPWMNPAANPNVPPDHLPIWAHDDTVEPGKTYVYRIRVIVRNPLYGQENLVKDPALAKQLDLAQAWSDWSEPVTIAASMRMQFAGAILNREQARFKVWRWQNGVLNGPREFTVAPGDMIGGVDRNPAPANPAFQPVGVPGAAPQTVDYTTGWSLVDIRRSGANNFRAVLVNEQGHTEVRHLNDDLANPEFRKLEPPPVTPVGLGG